MFSSRNTAQHNSQLGFGSESEKHLAQMTAAWAASFKSVSFDH